MSTELIGFLLIAGIIIFVLVWFKRRFKTLTLPCVYFVSGAVKTGKTAISVGLAKREYRKAVRSWYIKRFIAKLFRRNDNDLDYKPMLYSNIPLRYIKFNRLTIDVVMQKVRIPNNSIVLIDEISLFADSQLFQDKITNGQLMRFYKLFGHYSHGGKLIINSQSVADNHYTLKRCLSHYLYIYSNTRLPFVSIFNVRECIYSDDGSMTNNFNEDIELSMRQLIFFNSLFKSYDKFCYSIFTDDLPYQVNYTSEKLTAKDSLKCDYIVSLNDFVNKINEDYAKRIGVVNTNEINKA